MSEVEVISGTELVQVGVRSKHIPALVRQQNPGAHLVFRFPNGYGASLVVGTLGAYGGLEMAVLVWESTAKGDDDYHLCYDTPITDDVLGYLTRDELEPLLDSIAALPAAVLAVTQ